MNLNLNQLAISSPKTFAFGVGGVILIGLVGIYGTYKLINKHGIKCSYKNISFEVPNNSEVKKESNNISNTQIAKQENNLKMEG